MALKLGNEFRLGSNFLLGRKRSIVLRQDILKFLNTNIELTTSAGVPQGQWEVGSFFYNKTDQKLYISSNYKSENTPDTGWFKFDGNVTDFSTQKLSGTLIGGSFVQAKYRKGLELDGVDDKLTLPGAIITGSPYTIGMWIKLPSDFANGEEIYIYERRKDADEYVTVSIVGNATPEGEVRIRAQNVGGGPDDFTYTGVPIPLDTFIYLQIRLGLGNDSIRVDEGLELHNKGFGHVSFTTEEPTIGFSVLDNAFGDNSFIIDDLKFFTSETAGSLDKIDLDINHWRSYSGSFGEAT